MSFRNGVLISFFDQALLSITNFLIGIFLIRHTGKADYGQYVLAFAVILYSTGIQNAVITVPMTVLAPGKTRLESDHFCSGLATGQYLLFIPLCIISLITTAALAYGGVINRHQAMLMAAVAFAVQAVALREFFRGLFSQRLKPQAVLLLDMVYVAMLACGFMVSWKQLPMAAIVIMGVASALTGVGGWLLARLPLETSVTSLRQTLAESWRHGKWALAGVTVTWLQDQSYIYLLTMLAGAASTAEASAARLFLAPVALLTASFARTLMPRWATLRHEGKTDRIRRMLNKTSLILTGLIVLYAMAVFFGREPILRNILTTEYQGAASLISLWSVLLILQAVRANYSWALQVFCRFRLITLANGVSATVVLLSGLILITRYGAAGSITAMIIGEALFVSLLWKAYARTV